MRNATEAEKKWCDKLRRLMRDKPKTMALIADGQLKAVCLKELKRLEEMPEFQPLIGTASLGHCEGGDPWK